MRRSAWLPGTTPLERRGVLRVSCHAHHHAGDAGAGFGEVVAGVEAGDDDALLDVGLGVVIRRRREGGVFAPFDTDQRDRAAAGGFQFELVRGQGLAVGVDEGVNPGVACGLS